ncbi:hypothetical protein ACFLRC_00125, partial [Candidatus Altiarchaeota archaeon]
MTSYSQTGKILSKEEERLQNITEGKEKSQEVELVFRETEEELFQACYDPKEKRSFFAIYNRETGEVSYDDLRVEGLRDEKPRLLKPIFNDLVEKKAVLLPTKAEDYGSEAELVQEIQDFIHKYLDVEPFWENLGAQYVLLSHTYDGLTIVPYIRALGDWGTAKTRLILTIGMCCYMPMKGSGATTSAAVKRMIEKHKGTLIIDEGDFKDSGEAADIIKIFNTGFENESPVISCEPEGRGEYEPKAYRTFCPKLISSRKRWKDKALE